MLSDVAKSIIETNHGYRNDNLFDGNDFRISDVIKWECSELLNQDILEYLSCTNPVNAILYVHNYFGHANVYGYWFTDKAGVIEYYHGDTEEITRFELPKKYIILSDLGPDGILIASETPKSQLAHKIITI